MFSRAGLSYLIYYSCILYLISRPNRDAKSRDFGAKSSGRVLPMWHTRLCLHFDGPAVTLNTTCRGQVMTRVVTRADLALEERKHVEDPKTVHLGSGARRFGICRPRWSLRCCLGCCQQLAVHFGVRQH